MSEFAPRPKCLWQISLRGLFLFVTLVTVTLVLILRWDGRARQQRDAVRMLNADSTAAYYENDRDPENDSPVPAFLSGVLGFDHFYSVNQVRLWNATDEQMGLLEDLPKVTELEFTFESKCTDAGLERIRALPRLRRLDIDKARDLGDPALAAIGSLDELQQLNFTCGPQMTDAGLAQLARLRDLKSLHVTCRLDARDRELAWLSSVSQLEELGLKVSQELSFDEDVGKIVSRKVGVCRPGSLAPFKRLTRLYLDADAEFIRQCLSQLGELSALKRLSVTSDVVRSDFDLSEFAKLTALKRLYLARRWESEAESELSDFQLTHIAAARSLKTLLLVCGGGTMTDAGITRLGGLTELKYLEITPGEAVTDDGLAALVACRKLERMRLHLNDSVTGEGLAALDQLEFLELHCGTKQYHSPPLRLRLPAQVADLVIHGGQRLTDDDLDQLSNFPKLKRLEFFRCAQLTDDGLKRLAQLTQLKELGIHWCDQTTDAAINDLRTALPNCSIQSLKGGGNFGGLERFLPFGLVDDE